MSERVDQDLDTFTGLPCRSVTAAEVEHYHEFGWVKLKSFLHPEIVRILLDRATSLMGEDGASNEDFGYYQSYFNPYPCNGLQIPTIAKLINHIGENAKVLMARKSGAGTRWFQDTLVPKLPASKKTDRAGNGPTSFHQDFITFAVDRSGGMTFWIPLEPCGPEKGTMSFVSKSHTLGVLGNYTAYEGRDIREVWPELNDLEMTDPMVYDLGDVTVHNHLTVHGAGKNMADTPRWAYIVSTQPNDAHWNGAPPEAFDPAHLKPYELLDEERFPTLAPSG